LRILYAYPSYFDDELIEEIATNPKARCQPGCMWSRGQFDAIGISKLCCAELCCAVLCCGGPPISSGCVVYVVWQLQHPAVLSFVNFLLAA
jgi:hypothetical protein